MSRTATSVGIAGRLPARDIPLDSTAQAWLRLVDVVLDAASDPAWVAVVPPPNEKRPRSAAAPIIHGATFELDVARWLEVIRRLARIARDVGGTAPPWSRIRRLDPESLAGAAIARDAQTLTELATSAEVDVGSLTVLAQLAVIPMLTACARQLAATVPSSWLHGYCPICGAWPTMAETRGLERSRHLRCACCGTDWALPPLMCVFCGEQDHHKLGSLLIDGDTVPRRVDTCESCHGYLKTVTTLGALSYRALALEDLSTVALDLAARERGYTRPERAGYAIAVTVRDRRPEPNGAGRWFRSVSGR
jgi:FdhE protein